jgi:hypothetical protein
LGSGWPLGELDRRLCLGLQRGCEYGLQAERAVLFDEIGGLDGIFGLGGFHFNSLLDACLNRTHSVFVVRRENGAPPCSPETGAVVQNQLHRESVFRVAISDMPNHDKSMTAFSVSIADCACMRLTS